jgi:hypothetical protein
MAQYLTGGLKPRPLVGGGRDHRHIETGSGIRLGTVDRPLEIAERAVHVERPITDPQQDQRTLGMTLRMRTCRHLLCSWYHVAGSRPRGVSPGFPDASPALDPSPVPLLDPGAGARTLSLDSLRRKSPFVPRIHPGALRKNNSSWSVVRGSLLCPWSVVRSWLARADQPDPRTPGHWKWGSDDARERELRQRTTDKED